MRMLLPARQSLANLDMIENPQTVFVLVKEHQATTDCTRGQRNSFIQYDRTQRAHFPQGKCPSDLRGAVEGNEFKVGGEKTPNEPVTRPSSTASFFPTAPQ